MVAGDRRAGLKLIDPAVMGPPLPRWPHQARDVHDERIVATGFGAWLAGHAQGQREQFQSPKTIRAVIVRPASLACGMLAWTYAEVTCWLTR